jgi:hypothetical protein
LRTWVSLKSAMKGPRHEAIAERVKRALPIMMDCVVSREGRMDLSFILLCCFNIGRMVQSWANLLL